MRHCMRSGAAHRIDCVYTRPTWYICCLQCSDMSIALDVQCSYYNTLRVLCWASYVRWKHGTARTHSHVHIRSWTEWVSEWLFIDWLTDSVGWWTVWDARQWRVGVAVWLTDRHSHIELLTDWDCDHTQCCVSVKWWWMLDCCISLLFQMLPSVLWHWSLGVRKSIRPVKFEWWGVGVVSCLERGADCLHMVQLMPLPSQTTSSLASFKSRLVLLWFLHLLLQVVLEKRPLSGYTGSC